MPSYIPIDSKSDFSIHNIPFGVFVVDDASSSKTHCATILGKTVISLRILSEAGKFDKIEGYKKAWFEGVSSAASIQCQALVRSLLNRNHNSTCSPR
jgi:hypothetical protein